jgi:hypothetical protein
MSQADSEKEIPSGATVLTRLAFTGNPHAGSIRDASGDSDVDRAGLSIVLHGEAPRRSVKGVLERELDLVFDVASLSRRPRPRATSSLGTAEAAAEEGVEEVGERIGVTEQRLHLLGRHRAEASGRPTGSVAPRRPGLRAAGTGLLVHPPVRAQLVVLASLLGIAEHFVGLVDLLEPGSAALSPGFTSG